MEVEPVPEGLDDSYHSGHQVHTDIGPHVLRERSQRAHAKITEESSSVSEEGSNDLRDRAPCRALSFRDDAACRSPPQRW